MKQKPVAILLCAGQGTRMQDDRTHKVCYEIAGVPAIIRQIRHMKEAGIDRFVVVVGNKADKVMDCLDGVEGVVYAYQPRQTGTGSAALYGLKALASTDYQGPTLIAMGDKIIAPEVYRSLMDCYEETGAQAAFAVQPKGCNTSGGRIVLDQDRVVGIVEKMDSCLLALGDVSSEEYERVLDGMQLSQSKRDALLKTARTSTHLPNTMQLCGCTYTAAEIEAGDYVNTATYLVDVKTMLRELQTLRTDNAQGELYLTQAINAIAEQGKAEILVVPEPEKILTYSTMEELLKIQEYFTKPTSTRKFTTVSEWISRFTAWNGEMRAHMERLYGDDPGLLVDRRDAYLKVLQAFQSKYGDKEVVIARSPGRVNLIGRHIEHRGGSINVMPINRETILVAAARGDDLVNLANVDPNFMSYQFSILENINQYDTTNWVDFIESDSILKMVVDSKGEWVNYVKAGLLRLQLQYKSQILRGMDVMVIGDIPMAAGLSSSSSIVVATAEAAIALNNLDIQAKEFIHLCGEGEWFVGSRGGAGDHAAMKCGQRDCITHLTFCPFEIGESVEFPTEYQVVVANSFVMAKKSAGAKDQFNQRVACYEFGFMMVRHLFPQYRERLNYLKDLNAEHLQVLPSKIYEILLAIPERMTSEELHAALPEYREQIDRIQKSHAIPAFYELRSVILYGIAECARAERCLTLLKARDYEALGALMNISHNGDRVYQNGAPYDYTVSDEMLLKLITDLRSEDAARVASAQIYYQPGGYACSTREIDEMVDFINAQPGVVGSELSGAGLGGCIIILVRTAQTQALLDTLRHSYYTPKGLPMGAQVFIPVAGSQVLNF